MLRLELDKEEIRRKISLLVDPKVTAIKVEVRANLDRILKESVLAELRAWELACWAVDKSVNTNGRVDNHNALTLLTPTKVRAHLPPF